MALIERLMGLADDGVTPDPSRKIPVHAFFAANHQRIEAQLTRLNVIDLFTLSGDQVTEYDALAALAPTGTTALATAQKAMFIEKVHSACILAAVARASHSPCSVLPRTKLGL